jgi:hypothetical protein
MSDKKDLLKKRVLEFVKEQPGYNEKKHEKLDAFCEDEDTYMVVYGDNFWSGIAGQGSTPELAYIDFVTSWDRYKGFVWIEKNQ